MAAFLRNPMTGEVKFFSTRLSKRKYQSYGWVSASRAEYEDYQRAKIQSAMMRNLPGLQRRIQ